MANNIEDVSDALKDGSNGVEFDVRFTPEGKPLNVYHGFVCDCFRKCDGWTNFETYIQYIRNVTTPSHDKYNVKLTLAFIDLKTSDFPNDLKRKAAGQKLFNSLLKHLFNFGNVETRVKVVLSLMNTYDEYIIRGFMDSMLTNRMQVLNAYIGWDISNGEALGAIRFMYKRLLKTYDLNIWQSDGITNCLSLIIPRDRVTSAVQVRDSRGRYMSKVCLWTIDLSSHMRESLRIGVDAILTNYPATLRSVLKEIEFSGTFRLATHDDDPWIKYEVSK